MNYTLKPTLLYFYSFCVVCFLSACQSKTEVDLTTLDEMNVNLPSGFNCLTAAEEYWDEQFYPYLDEYGIKSIAYDTELGDAAEDYFEIVDSILSLLDGTLPYTVVERKEDLSANSWSVLVEIKDSSLLFQTNILRGGWIDDENFWQNIERINQLLPDHILFSPEINTGQLAVLCFGSQAIITAAASKGFPYFYFKERLKATIYPTTFIALSEPVTIDLSRISEEMVQINNELMLPEEPVYHLQPSSIFMCHNLPPPYSETDIYTSACGSGSLMSLAEGKAVFQSYFESLFALALAKRSELKLRLVRLTGPHEYEFIRSLSWEEAIEYTRATFL